MENLDFEKVKAEVHRALLSQVDLEKLSTTTNGKARVAVAELVQQIIASQRVPLNGTEKERIQADVLDDVFGLGPLEPLLKDRTISDILVNNKDLVFIERNGMLKKAEAFLPGSGSHFATCPTCHVTECLRDGGVL